MSLRTRLAAATLFAAAMAFFEAALAVYLRHLWEIGELSLEEVSLSDPIWRAELFREAASLLMIFSVAFLSGRSFTERLWFASVIFGLWDILYYAYLHFLIGFPLSLLEWDVLFLIPAPWIGPVLAPLLVSVAFVGGGLWALRREARGAPVRPDPVSWTLAIAGGAVIVLSFLVSTTPQSPTDTPTGFSWLFFLAGFAVALGGYARSLRRPRRGA